MNKQSMAAALALVLLAGPAAMTQAKEPQLVTNDHGLTETVMTMRVRGDLTFGTDGVVKEHHIATKLDPKMAEYVDKTIAKWRFKPYLQDGVPVNAKTYFQMTLAARPVGENYELSVDNAYFHDKAYLADTQMEKKQGSSKCVTNCLISQPRQPGYPMGLAMAGVSGAVMVHLYLNPDGTVADAMVAQSALYNVRGGDKTLDEARKLLEKDVLRFARGVRAAPASGSPLVGDPHFVGAISVEFRADERAIIDNEGKWRLEQRGKRNVASWLVHDPDRWIGVSDIAGSGFIAMKDSPYKLVSDTSNAAP